MDISGRNEYSNLLFTPIYLVCSIKNGRFPMAGIFQRRHWWDSPVLAGGIRHCENSGMAGEKIDPNKSVNSANENATLQE